MVQTGYFRLRRRSARYKNPQLSVQHCLVASFGSMFLVFYQLFYLFQLVPRQKCLFQVKESCSRALVFFEQQILASLLVFHLAPNLSWIYTNQINQSARYISSTCNNVFCCVTLPDKLKKRNIYPKLQQQQCFIGSNH